MGNSPYTISMTPVEHYLRGRVGYPITEEAILSILIDRAVDPGTPIMDLTRKQRDLCVADLYMRCAAAPSTTGSTEDSDAGWKHRDGGSQRVPADTSRLIAMANRIYKMYGEAVEESRVRMRTAGMKIWKK